MFILKLAMSVDLICKYKKDTFMNKITYNLYSLFLKKCIYGNIYI